MAAAEEPAASFMSVDSDRLDRAKLGLAPLSFGIGGFFSRRFALTSRGTGTSLFIDRGNGTEQVVLAYYGPSLQYYAAESVFVGGGVGLGVLAGNPFVDARQKSRLDPLGISRS